MSWPNSVIKSGVGAFGVQPAPAPIRRVSPVPRPPGPQPRRKPGRPQPHRPRRPAQPKPRPAPPRPARPPSSPGGPGRFPDRTPGLNYAARKVQGPKLLEFKPAPMSLWRATAGGFGRLFWPTALALAAWEIDNQWRDTLGKVTLPLWMEPAADSGVRLWSKDFNGPDYPGIPWVFNGITSGSGYAPGGALTWAGAPYNYELGNQAGYTSGGFIPHPYIYVRDIGATGRVFTTVFRNPVTNATRGWFEQSWRRFQNAPNYDVLMFWPRPAFYDAAEGALPYSNLFNAVPDLRPVQGGKLWAEPLPIYRPISRPAPMSPQMPDVGPRPGEQPAGSPAELVNVWYGVGQYHAPNVVTQPHPQIVRRPPRGTKERKARLGRIGAFLWHAANPVTEANDTVKAVYEALPKRIKREAYEKYGRQPTFQEKLVLIYENINELDVSKAVLNIIKNNAEDRIWALGSKETAKASREWGRPLGITAGPAL